MLYVAGNLTECPLQRDVHLQEVFVSGGPTLSLLV